MSRASRVVGLPERFHPSVDGFGLTREHPGVKAEEQEGRRILLCPPWLCVTCFMHPLPSYGIHSFTFYIKTNKGLQCTRGVCAPLLCLQTPLLPLLRAEITVLAEAVILSIWCVACVCARVCVSHECCCAWVISGMRAGVYTWRSEDIFQEFPLPVVVIGIKLR